MKIQIDPNEVLDMDDQIAKRAYEIWQTNGSLHGSDVEHWLQAKAELIAVEQLEKATVLPKGTTREIKPVAANVR
jgi:hypothetical protein